MEKKRKTKTKRTFRIKRLDAKTGSFVTDTFLMGAKLHTTVLDALLEIKETKDATLSMRYSCRMGICGSCGMVINGKPSLACQTVVSKIDGDINIAPMMGHPILKDIVNDFDDFFEKHRSIMPWIIARNDNEKFHPKAPTKEGKENVERLIPFSSCIKCGLCLDACPVVNTNPLFVGPQALAQEHKLMLDQRDQGFRKRLELVDTKDGIWACEFVGACSTVCPKGVDPALAIQELKVEAITEQIFGLRKKGGRPHD
ncbi:MAG: succinate dehydrogenase/fumarate reductase iron-sulfur subunit [Candidatus Micrarchaeaceae archaeon]